MPAAMGSRISARGLANATLAAYEDGQQPSFWRQPNVRCDWWSDRHQVDRPSADDQIQVAGAGYVMRSAAELYALGAVLEPRGAAA